MYFANRIKLDFLMVVGAFEVALDVYTVLELLHNDDFINAGVVIGKGFTNAIFYLFFLILSIIKHFKPPYLL